MKLNTQLITKNHTRIHHVGLDARDALVIESTLRSLPGGSERYAFGPAQIQDDVDLLFVNGDDPAALLHWDNLHRARPELVGILVAEKPDTARSDMAYMQRPIAMRDSLGMLQAITSARCGAVADAGKDTLRVLVVDDSFPARQYMKVKLRELAADSLKLAIDFVDGGERAIAALRETAYDVAFVDVVMPGMNGYDVCRELKKIRPLRVAMLTGQNAYLDFQQGKRAGCDHYLTKPPHDTDLRSVLRLTSLRKITTA